MRTAPHRTVPMIAAGLCARQLGGRRPSPARNATPQGHDMRLARSRRSIRVSSSRRSRVFDLG
jgi:hypothetical protein